MVGGAVARHISKSGLTPKYKKLCKHIIGEEARTNEQRFIEEYGTKGWIILNSTKAGALGGNAVKWTKVRLPKVAKLYKRRIDFNHSPVHYTAYSAAAKHGWLQDVCKHMKLLKTYWSKEKCIKEAKRYKTRKDFGKKSGGAYNYALKHGFIDEACSHMSVNFKSWTVETCKIEAKKYLYRHDFEKGSRSAYEFAKKRGLLSEVCSHMKYRLISWDKEKCRKEAQKYNSRKNFQIGWECLPLCKSK